jgi:hypothetical protein
MDHWLTAREQQRGYFELSEVIDDADALIPVEFAGVMLRVGVLIAMQAFQIAAAGDIPDNNGPTLSSCGWRTMATTISQVVHRLGDIAVKTGKIDHEATINVASVPHRPPDLAQ